MSIDPFKRKQEWRSYGKGPGGRNLCHCGCGREVQPPRRTAFSDECVRKWNERNSPATIRQILKERDKEVCALCGTDTKIRRKMIRETEALWSWLAMREGERLFQAGMLQGYDGQPAYAWGQISWWRDRQVAEQMKEHGYERDSLHDWEADHIVPVAEGGGGCGPEGYRTLCLRCHKQETAALAARLAAKRRAAKKQPELQL